LGTRINQKAGDAPCNCVFRAIFRACYNRFRECVALGERTSAVTLEHFQGIERITTYSRQREEYMCDFDLVSRRSLTEFEYKIFRYHFLFGADWRLCCRQLHLDRGLFFHTLYRVEEKLGRIFAELRPYPLFPLDEYFGTVGRRKKAA
jgi:hypothetical protein